MNKAIRKLVVVGIMLMFLVGATTASAITYSGAWDPTSGNMFAIQLSLLPSASALYMYDFGGDTSKTLGIVKDQLLSYNTIYFSKNATTSLWYAGTSLGSQTLALGVTPDFAFMFQNGSTQYFSYDLQKVNLPLWGSNLYELKAAGMDVVVSGAQPVPEPSTLLLLGLGIFGIAIFGLRRRIGTR